jgi:hypothetical protein
MGCRLTDLLARSQGFKEAEGDVAMARILPDEQHQLLPEYGEAEGPVSE